MSASPRRLSARLVLSTATRRLACVVPSRQTLRPRRSKPPLPHSPQAMYQTTPSFASCWSLCPQQLYCSTSPWKRPRRRPGALVASLIRCPPNHRRRRRNPRIGVWKPLAQKCTVIAVTTRGRPRSWSWKAMLSLDRYAGILAANRLVSFYISSLARISVRCYCFKIAL